MLILLENKQCNIITAGNSKFIIALQTGINVYLGSADSIAEANQRYAQMGHVLSESLFNLLHPHPLGKMCYTSQDFAMK